MSAGVEVQGPRPYYSKRYSQRMLKPLVGEPT